MIWIFQANNETMFLSLIILCAIKQLDYVKVYNNFITHLVDIFRPWDEVDAASFWKFAYQQNQWISIDVKYFKNCDIAASLKM